MVCRLKFSPPTRTATISEERHPTWNQTEYKSRKKSRTCERKRRISSGVSGSAVNRCRRLNLSRRFEARSTGFRSTSPSPTASLKAL
jgi:hypothetical protein